MSLVFIVGVMVIQQQLKFIQTKNLGYDRENVLCFQRSRNDGDPQIFLDELRRIPGVIACGNMASSITNRFDTQTGYSWRGEETDKKILFESPRIGYDVIEALDIKLIAGRTFSRDRQDDYSKIILNESAVALMDLNDPVGRIIYNGSGDYRRPQEIIGVVRDFQYGSIHKKIAPMILRFRADERDIIVRYKSDQEQAIIAEIDKLYQEFHPDFTFNYTFLNDDYRQLYQAENRVAVLSRFFGGLTIIISCLGLFGLAMFTTEKRRKEISIRKVLGASVFGIIQLLTKEFSKTILIAILIAIPFSYFLCLFWLESFAYSIKLSFWHFFLPALLILVIACLTVTTQTFQAARVDPASNLKDE
ncbi:MAG: hypothetical protein KDC80_16290 [Saprospiraceae bacterium]|nr:hypothetical protein [Saprospiraceae bacterium]